jgi:hypothetical protein
MIPIKAPMIIGSACSSRHRAREDLMYAAAISAAFKALSGFFPPNPQNYSQKYPKMFFRGLIILRSLWSL